MSCLGRGREGDILPTVEVKEGVVGTAYASNLRGPVGDAIQNRRVQRSFIITQEYTTPTYTNCMRVP